LLAIPGVYSVYVAATAALSAEKKLHTARFVIQLVNQFVQEHKRWPKSWDELTLLQLPRDFTKHVNGFYGRPWPGSLEEIKKRIAIDFSADPTKVVAEDKMAFSAIKAIGGYYEYRHYGDVDELQATIRRVLLK
jgi:hypothetical protein